MHQRTADIEEVRFRYEVIGESVEDICSDLKILKTDLYALVAQEAWVQADIPGQGATDEEVNTYYKQGRMRLTTLMTRRAIKQYAKLMQIEDRVIEAIMDSAKDLDSADSQGLARVVTAYSKLLDKQAMLHEAISTPALADKKIEELIKASSLAQFLESIDGRGRKLPSEDNESIDK